MRAISDSAAPPAPASPARVQEDAAVLGHLALGHDYVRLELAAPRIAARARPGQFVHLRLPGTGPQLLRRPLSIYQAYDGRIALLYKVVGGGTARLAGLRPGQTLDLLGPLGRPFEPPPAGTRAVLVAGGYGAAALYLLARACAAPGTIFIGGRRAQDILCAADYEALGWSVRVTTEDGSRGERGLVTEPLAQFLDTKARQAEGRAQLYACGPNAMLAAVARLAAARRVPCQVSVDMPMCCGVGACLTCVIRVADPAAPAGWTWARTCTEGPVFDAATVIWDALG